MAYDTVINTEEEEEEMLLADGEPVSPTGQYFNSSVLSISVLAIFESDIAIDDSPTMWTLENVFLPIHPRFSSIMVKDERGVRQWKRVSVNLADHVNVPVFPAGLQTYDEQTRDYISHIALGHFPATRPLWDLHIIKYPTKQAAGTIVFRLHHALGDGYSLMSALFACVRRADDPSLPLTYPSSSSSSSSSLGAATCGGWRCAWRTVPRALSVCMNTLRDFGWGLLKSNFLEDDRSPLRSAAVGVEFRPVEISTISFSLDDIKQIKEKLGGTVNDVIAGIIFYGSQLYLRQAKSTTRGSSKKNAERMTALILLNTRLSASYRPLQEMNKPYSSDPWGNNFGFLHVSIPTCSHWDPLSFVHNAREIIKAKKRSFAVFLIAKMLETIRKLRGAEAAARYIYSTLQNTSMTITNMIGPMEQMIIAGHPVKSISFLTVGSPQSLTISIVSYMGNLKVTMGSEKGFIDSGLLVSCMKKSFQNILKEATGK
ncbi:O-acyltransferase WSD1-like [Canna indica]|uniref:O-acyltransferase WSD1-like n=1 Tax=Canna indica TaxID=4628 RepID=A0AAQ3L582_9LILI|nr:O-acyltransferase WSD1-like [Canna indica]